MTRLRFLLPLCALLVVTGACGDNSKTSGTTTTAASGTSAAAGDTKAFTDCLKDHGIDLPANFGGGPGADGSGGAPPAGGAEGAPPAGFDPSKMQDAQKACQSLAPAGGAGAPGGFGQGADNAAYTSCLKDHGVELPDAASAEAGPPSSIPVDNGAMQAAQQACQALLPSGGAGGPGATSTTVAS